MTITLKGPLRPVKRGVYFEHDTTPTEHTMTIFASRETSIAQCLAQCTLECYGSQASADRAKANFQRLRERGALASISNMGPDTFLIVRWHVWTDGIGSPRFELPQWQSDIHNAYKLLTALIRRIEGHPGIRGNGPDAWRAALGKMRAQQVWTMRHPDYGFELCTLRRGLEAPLELAA